MKSNLQIPVNTNSYNTAALSFYLVLLLNKRMKSFMEVVSELMSWGWAFFVFFVWQRLTDIWELVFRDKHCFVVCYWLEHITALCSLWILTQSLCRRVHIGPSSCGAQTVRLVPSAAPMVHRRKRGWFRWGSARRVVAISPTEMLSWDYTL